MTHSGSRPSHESGEKRSRRRGLAAMSLLVGIVSFVMLGAMATIAWGESVFEEQWDVAFVDAYTNDDGVVNDPEHDPRDTGLDPPYDKAVASCAAEVEPDIVRVTMVNGYPSYTCHFWVMIRNMGLDPVRRGPVAINAPPELTVVEVDSLSCLTLQSGEREVETFSVHIEQQALYGTIYELTIEKVFGELVQGTLGFWKNWDRHETFSEAQIEAWLAQVDADSDWLGPTTVEAMGELFDAAKGGRATMESQFLAHYLATRLNNGSGTLCALERHDVSGLDPENYLGLTDPLNASLAEIIAAMERKHSTDPTDAEFRIMKDLADALNCLDV